MATTPPPTRSQDSAAAAAGGDGGWEARSARRYERATMEAELEADEDANGAAIRGLRRTPGSWSTQRSASANSLAPSDGAGDHLDPRATCTSCAGLGCSACSPARKLLGELEGGSLSPPSPASGNGCIDDVDEDLPSRRRRGRAVTTPRLRKIAVGWAFLGAVTIAGAWLTISLWRRRGRRRSRTVGPLAFRNIPPLPQMSGIGDSARQKYLEEVSTLMDKVLTGPRDVDFLEEVHRIRSDTIASSERVASRRGKQSTTTTGDSRSNNSGNTTGDSSNNNSNNNSTTTTGDSSSNNNSSSNSRSAAALLPTEAEPPAPTTPTSGDSP
ncbi:hypothetical protein RI054_22g97880 [Pseudoscourfieldia marina]